MLDVKGLTQAHDGRVVLQLDHWQVAAGRSCCITGPSGSGKTTLLVATHDRRIEPLFDQRLSLTTPGLAP